jgi:hypothetical protein
VGLWCSQYTSLNWKGKDAQFNFDAAIAAILACGCSSIFNAGSRPLRRLVAALGLQRSRLEAMNFTSVEPKQVQSVDQGMRLECGVGFRQLRTYRRTRPGLWAKRRRHTGLRQGYQLKNRWRHPLRPHSSRALEFERRRRPLAYRC